jgi:hypothetical protein
MRLQLLTLLLLLFSSISNAYVVEAAYEAGSIKIEYYEATEEGRVFVDHCDNCKQKIYKFTTPPKINVKDKEVNLKQYIKTQTGRIAGTIVIDVRTKSIIRINF